MNSLRGITLIIVGLLPSPALLAADKQSPQSAQAVSTQQLARAVVAAATDETPRLAENERPDPIATIGRFHRQAKEHQAWQQASHCQQDPLSTQTKLCGLRWRNGDAFSSAVDSYNEFTTKTKSRFIGKDLADKIELDDGGVRFQVKF